MEKEMGRTLDEAVKMENLETKLQKRKKLPGFTLIEIIAVMAIIGVMAAALLPSIQTAMNKSKDTEIINNLAMLDSAAKVYELEKGTAPESIQALVDGKYVPDKEYAHIEFKGDHFEGTLSDETTRKSNELGVKSSGNDSKPSEP